MGTLTKAIDGVECGWGLLSQLPPIAVFFTLWRHQMETFSALLALCAGNSSVTGEFSSKRASNGGFGVFCDVSLNKRLNKQPSRWWFEIPVCSLWRYCNVSIISESTKYHLHVIYHAVTIYSRCYHSFAAASSLKYECHWKVFTKYFCMIHSAWWRHKMDTFSALLAFVRGSHRSPVNSPHKGKWRGALVFSLICAWINGWVNSGEAGDLRGHCAHYDVTVMVWGVEINIPALVVLDQ